MNRAFIRALWGDELVRNWQKARRDVCVALSQPYQVPFETYVFGTDNAKFIESFGIKPILLHADGIVNFFGSKKRRPKVNGHWNYDSHFFRHKLVAIHAALKKYDEIIWLDWDCKLHEPLPDDFWDHYSEGYQPIRATLRKYGKRNRVKAHWREHDWQLVPGGGFNYIRGVKIAEEMLSVHASMPHKSDEDVLAFITDRTMKGWHNAEKYRDFGFESVGYYFKKQVWHPERTIFSAV